MCVQSQKWGWNCLPFSKGEWATLYRIWQEAQGQKDKVVNYGIKTEKEGVNESYHLLVTHHMAL